MSDVIPLLLDTDIGTNIDDALALAYLLRQTRCDLLGITTVSGDVARRAACAEAICRAAGRSDLPIHCGATGPLLLGAEQRDVPLYDAIRRYPHRLDYQPNTAVDFLRQTIRRFPGQITLLTIGPLTNIALLFAMDPQVPSMLRQVVSMLGVYRPHERIVETNCRLDPIAAAMVLSARPPRHVCVGLDVTSQCRMDCAQAQQALAKSNVPPLAHMLRAWCARRDEVVFHDPLAAAVVFHPELCHFDAGRIAIDLDANSPTCGRTRFSVAQSEPPTHYVASAVDAPEFFNEYLSIVTH